MVVETFIFETYLEFSLFSFQFIVIGPKSYACTICSTYTTKRIYNITRHVRSHTGEKPFQCSYCPYAAIERGTLRNHIEKNHHETSKSIKLELVE
jgi:uncharacterized Zn-finger protein